MVPCPCIMGTFRVLLSGHVHIARSLLVTDQGFIWVFRSELKSTQMEIVHQQALITHFCKSYYLVLKPKGKIPKDEGLLWDRYHLFHFLLQKNCEQGNKIQQLENANIAQIISPVTYKYKILLPCGLYSIPYTLKWYYLTTEIYKTDFTLKIFMLISLSKS